MSMNKQCEIVQDLLPLYVDSACSKSSAAMVEEHLENCLECKVLYKKLCADAGEDMLKTEIAGIVAKHKKEKAADDCSLCTSYNHPHLYSDHPLACIH